MEIVQFDITGKFAHFRKYYANNTALTYSLPPRTTVMGMLAAICGMSRDSYYEELASDKIRIGIAIKTPIKKNFHRLNFLSLKSLGDFRKSFDSDFRGMTGNPIQTPYEIVTGYNISEDSVCYRIFLGSTDAGKSTFQLLKRRLLARDSVFTLTLGPANFHASLADVVSYEKDQIIKKQASAEYISFDSAVNSEDVTELVFEKEEATFVEEELLPADFIANHNRELSKMNRALFTTGGVPLKVRLTGNYYIIQSQTTSQTIQFLENEMTFYSHSKILQTGKKIGVKTMEKHTNNVLANAQLALERTVCFTLSQLQLKSLLEDLCRYHDLGKYTAYFQRYLLTDERVDPNLKAHARFGAYAIFRKYQDKELTTAALLYFMVVYHHMNLDNIGDNEFNSGVETENNQKDFFTQKRTLDEFIATIKQELRDEKLEEYLRCPDGGLFYKAVKEIVKKADIQNYFLVNYLFSLLIEADKLDASDTPFYALQTVTDDLVDLYRPLSITTVSDLIALQEATQNDLRSYCRIQVRQFFLRKDWHAHRLFTLTAPTGIGKTLIALDFALKLRALIREKEQREARIIYALPFINIIEQAHKVYAEVLSDEGVRLLAHYQCADALEQTSFDEAKNYHQKTMVLDTWQCDVVITTFVQFLQTLIGNRNKLLKKFNHFAGAIIILDEVQTLRLEQLPLIGAIFYYLSKFLNARILLMTATKPKVFELANQEILKQEGEEAKSVELLPGNESIFACFHRTKIVSLIDQRLENETEFLRGVFFKKWQKDQSCIIVCNTVKRSLDVYRELSENLDVFLNPVYYLSTNIIPFHRQKVIDDISKDILAGRKPILVATQCVEAGVDLDFDMGFRDLGPIDSIIQVAGRINRNNHPDKKYSPLYIVDFGDCSRIYDAITTQQSQNSLHEHPELREEQYLELIETYFSRIAGHKSFQESRKIFAAMKCLKYDSDNPKTDIAISSFQVIKEKFPTLSVFIEWDENAVRLKDLFVKLLHTDISSEDFAPFKKDFHQHIISVPSHLPKAMDLIKSDSSLLCEGIYIVSKDRLADFYNITTGFDRIQENKQHSMFL